MSSLVLFPFRALQLGSLRRAFRAPALWAMLFLVLLAACGGGGGGSSPDDSGKQPGASRTFWVNTRTHPESWQDLSFSLAYQTSRANVWILPSDASAISPDLLKLYGDYFTQHTWPDVTGYVQEPTEFFGEPGNRINLLFFRMAENYAGYFWQNDYYRGAAGSNETNVFYLNIDAAVSSKDQSRATLFTEGTLTHEFQHMCSTQYFFFDPVGAAKARTMDSWASEFCSVTAESLFARQLDIYLPDYQRNAAFAGGQSDFLQWRNAFSQYSAVSLLGTYLVSQVPAANRPAFLKRFLANTCVEGSRLNTLTSVDDLLATLQDPQVGWTPSGWTPIADFPNQPNLVLQDWTALLKSFCIALTGADPAYNSFVRSISSQAVSPACIPGGAGSYALAPSGWIIGRTAVDDLACDSITHASMSASNAAYVFVFNGSIPAHSELAGGLPLASTKVSISAGQVEARVLSCPDGRVCTGTWPFTRASVPAASFHPRPQGMAVPSARSALLGAGDASNGGSASAGYNYCGYAAR